MASMLEKYRDVADELPAPIDDNETVEMSSSKAKRLDYYKKRELWVLKRLTKALRKQNKLLKMEAERRKAEEEAAVTAEKDKCDTRKKGFLKNLGDAICKAIPKVLTTLVTLAFGYFFKEKFPRKALQAT